MGGHNITILHKSAHLPSYQLKHVTRKSLSNVHTQINVYNCWRLKQTYATFQNILVLVLVKTWQSSEVNLLISSVKQLSSENWKDHLHGMRKSVLPPMACINKRRLYTWCLKWCTKEMGYKLKVVKLKVFPKRSSLETSQPTQVRSKPKHLKEK